MMADPTAQDWIRTASGNVFSLSDPTPEMFRIEDIAHALSRICRFCGHTRHFYSVAQHSVAVSTICPPENQLEGLLHDAPEAYVGDMSRPLKHRPDMEAYRLIEKGIWLALAEWAGLPATMSAEVKDRDNVMLVTEQRDLMVGSNWKHKLAEPLAAKIRPWPIPEAEERFLLRYRLLTRNRP